MARLLAASRVLGQLRLTTSSGSARGPAAATLALRSVSNSGDGSAPGGEDASAQAARDRPGGDTYYATPQAPGSSSESGDASAHQEAVAAASRAPHPAGPADTSSMNAPEGRSPQQPAGDRTVHVHHPGREADVAALSGQPEQQQPGGGEASGGGGGSRAASEGFQDPVPGGERAETADWAAGGDDITGGGMNDSKSSKATAKPGSGLPAMGGPEGGSAGQDSARFGRLRQPADSPDSGDTARQAADSTGMDPGGHASG